MSFCDCAFLFCLKDSLMGFNTFKSTSARKDGRKKIKREWKDDKINHLSLETRSQRRIQPRLHLATCLIVPALCVCVCMCTLYSVASHSHPRESCKWTMLLRCLSCGRRELRGLTQTHCSTVRITSPEQRYKQICDHFLAFQYSLDTSGGGNELQLLTLL